ncbi:MAG: glycosyltransferase family 4 protein [Bacteroidota bacterium]
MNRKVLIITSEFPPLPGGIGNHAFLLSKYLQKNGYEVSVVSNFRSREEDSVFDKKQNFTIYRIQRNKFIYMNRIRKVFSLAGKNEIIVASGKFSLWLGALLKCFFAKKKAIAILHGSELKAGGSISQKITKWSLLKFDKLIAVSEFTKQYALSVNSNLEIEVINNGIEVHHFESEPKVKPNGVHLVTVGNVTYRKGQQNMIQALPLLKEKFSQVQYHCIGIPTEQSDFLVLAKSLEVEDQVVFHGVLSDGERNEILKKSTVFVMLSQIVNNDFEGFGIALLEANAMGIPVVGSQDSGIADAISNGYSGFLVNQNNPTEILNAVIQVMENYGQFSSQAIEWSKNFDWNRIIKQYIEKLV